MNFFTVNLVILFAVFTVSFAENIRLRESKIETFDQYKIAFNKKYASRKAEDEAEKNFNESKKWIDENRKQFPDTVGFTSLSDQSAANYAGLKIDETIPAEGIEKLKLRMAKLNQTEPIPDFWDWRQLGYLSPVTAQVCGSCWAHAAAGAIEAYLGYNQGLPIQISIEELIDCAGEGHGCDSGDPWKACNYARSNGVSLKSGYPFGLLDAHHPHQCMLPLLQKIGFNGIPTLMANGGEFVDDVIIQQYLMEYGPIVVAVATGERREDEFLDRSRFIYKSYRSWHGVLMNFNQNPGFADHAMVIVGWGVSPNGTKYWILRNSAGYGWGLAGHLLLQRGINSMGINNQMLIYFNDSFIPNRINI